MADLDALMQEISDYGISIPTLAEKAGIPYRTLYNRLHGVGEFTVSEITSISTVLKFPKSKVLKIFTPGLS